MLEHTKLPARRATDVVRHCDTEAGFSLRIHARELLLYQQTQVFVSRSTMGRILQVMNLTRKKKLSMPVNKTVSASRT